MKKESDTINKKIIDKFNEPKMKKEVKEEVIRLLKTSRENAEPLEIVKEVKIQNSKQLFIRIPREIERLLNLKEGGKIRFITRIPPRNSNEKIKVRLGIER